MIKQYIEYNDVNDGEKFYSPQTGQWEVKCGRLSAVRAVDGEHSKYKYATWMRFRPTDMVYVIRDDEADLCPDCDSPLVSKIAGGVKCSNCSYWFCY